MVAGRHEPPEGALEDAARGSGVPVVGASMEPILPEGSRVRTGPAAGRPVRGDLVLFSRQGDLTVHRVIGLRGDRLRTKGDASVRAEPDLLAAADLLGVVVEAERSGRRTDLERPGWRKAGRWIACWSRAWDLAAALVPAALLNHPARPDGRLPRRLLRRANLMLPSLVDRMMRSTWE